MRERDPFGYITLHNGRAPIAQRIAHLLVIILSIALFFRMAGGGL